MIRINKSNIPGILEANQAGWTAELISSIKSGEKVSEGLKTRYRHVDIKNVIVEEAFGKCAYCEAKVRHTSPGDVDHIHPVSLNPESTYDWRNLVLACNNCNRNKNAYNGEAGPLVHPINDEPQDHIYFCGPMAFGSTAPGKVTKQRIDLNRSALTLSRQEHLEKLSMLAESWENGRTDEEKALLRYEVLKYIEPSSEYSAASFDFLSEICPEVLVRTISY